MRLFYSDLFCAFFGIIYHHRMVNSFLSDFYTALGHCGSDQESPFAVADEYISATFICYVLAFADLAI